jgi:hypothetical protein
MRAGKTQNGAGLVVLFLLAVAGPAWAEEAAPAEGAAKPPAPAGVALPHHVETHVEPYTEHHEDCDPGGIFVDAEYLYLKPRRDTLDFAILGPGTTGVPTGTVQALEWQYQSGVRAGGGYRLGGDGWEVGSYFTYLHSSAGQTVTRPANSTLFATLTHPGMIEQVDTASATSSVNFRVVDAELARRWNMCDSLSMKVFGGGRFAWIDQGLDAFYDGRDARMARVSSPIEFDGGGIRVGGEGRWVTPWWGLSLFARASGSLLLGDFTTSVLETNNNGARVNANVSYNFQKIVPVLDLGVGVTWQYRNLHVSAGYEMSNWFGLVDSPDFVDDLHQGKMARKVGDLSLDGFMVQMGLSF